nr:hypothetical protein [Penicillium meliponae]
MSFGWGAGDIATTIKLINAIVSSLRETSGAREQFQELETELFGLKRALKRIDSLTQSANPANEIQALKFVSLYCVQTLQRFQERIKPFEDSLGSQSQKTRLQAAPRMVRWQLLIKKDLPELRQYLVAHVGYLNLELSTASLKSVSRANESIEEIRLQNDRAIALIEQRIDNAATTQRSLEDIRETIERVWNYNNDLANMVRDFLQKPAPTPSARYTWVQEPIRFENALGNVIPVASESDWQILNAIITAQFSKGPGSKKVSAGEYELFEHSGNLMLPVDATTCPRLRPGMHITMAIIIGQYPGSQRCPRLGCSSILLCDAGVMGVAGALCPSCGTWVRRSKKTLPKPLRPPGSVDVALRPPVTGLISAGPANLPNVSPTYPDRIAYKNISIYVTELPPTPRMRIFRDQYQHASSPAFSRGAKPMSMPPAPVDGRDIPSWYLNDKSPRLVSLPPVSYDHEYTPASPVNGASLKMEFESLSTQPACPSPGSPKNHDFGTVPSVNIYARGQGDVNGFLCEPSIPSTSKQLAAAVIDLDEQIVDWKALKPDDFGYLLRFGKFPVEKTGNTHGKLTKREYHIYLFEKVMICCTAIKPSRLKKMSKEPKDPNKPRLDLKGRVFMKNVTDVVSLQKPDLFLIQIFWELEVNIVDNFIIQYPDYETMRSWHRDIESQRAIALNCLV